MQTRTYRVEVKYRRTMMAAINNITFSVMIFPTFDLHAVRSRLYKSCPEMDSGREFRAGISPKTKQHRLEEVMCTRIMCTCEQAQVREVCVCRKACFCRSIVLGTVWLLQKYKFYNKNRAQNRVGLQNDRRGPLTNPVKESASKKHEMVMSSASVDALQPLQPQKTRQTPALRRIQTIEHE